MKTLPDVIAEWKKKAKAIKMDVLALYIAYRHPGVPLHAKIFAAVVVAYALSPVDLIPDFIPVLGYLDDLLLVPLGITLAIKMLPEEILEECRNTAKERFENGKPVSKAGAAIIISIWIIIVVWILYRMVWK